MKKSAIALVGLLAVTALVGCNSKKGGGGKKKGPEPSDLAWRTAFNQSVYIGNNAASAEGENDVKPDEKEPAPFIALTKTNTVRPMGETEDYEFTYEYKFSAKVSGADRDANDFIEAQLESGAFNQTVVQFKGWPATTDDNAAFPRFTVEAIAKCNGHEQTKNYTMVLNPAQFTYQKKTLADLYTKHASLNALSFMRQASGKTDAYECDSGTSENTYYNIETQGKLIYATEDGNWGILQDGDKYLQLYRLDALKIWDKIKDSLIGHNIWLKGNLGFGYGNIQLGNIKSILPIKDGDSAHPVNTPAAEATYTESMVTNHEWWNSPLFNKVGSIGTVSVKDGKVYKVVNASGGATTDRTLLTDAQKAVVNSNSARFEFDVTIGSSTFVVATDYHANCGYDGKNSDGATTEAYSNLLRGLSAGQSLNLKGTIRWMNDRSVSGGNDYTIYNSGVWTITPFLAEHI